MKSADMAFVFKGFIFSRFPRYIKLQPPKGKTQEKIRLRVFVT